jgi:hypothetical protein
LAKDNLLPVLKITDIFIATRVSRLIRAGKELADVVAVRTETRINIFERYALGCDLPLRGQGLPQG